MKYICLALVFYTSTLPAVAQIMSVGIGLAAQQSTFIETHSSSTSVLNSSGYLDLVHDYQPATVNNVGGGFACASNLSFLGWLINNAWSDLGKGFYIGDYIDVSCGFGPYQRSVEGTKSDGGLLIWGAFGLGLQTGYKIPSQRDLASVELRWYLSGGFNSIRSSELSGAGASQDDFKNIGVTGRYGAYCVRMDFGYQHYREELYNREVKPKRFAIGCFWMFDRSKSYSHSSFSSSIGIKYEGFYNFYQNTYENKLNGQNHALSIELTILKF